MVGFSIHFLPEKRKNEKGKLVEKNVPLLYSVTWGGQRIKSTTGLKLDNLKDWSETRERFKPSAGNATQRNALLDEMEKKLERVYIELKIENDLVTKEMFKQHLAGKAQRGFWDYFRDFLRDESYQKGWSLSTMAKFTRLRKDLEEFNIEAKKPIEFSAINYQWYSDFFDFLAGKKNQNTTIKKKFKFLNQFLRWAIEKNKVKVADYNSYKVKTLNSGTKTASHLNMVFLTLEEFLAVVTATFPNQRLEKTRDIFVFLCATGLHIGQYLALTTKNIDQRKNQIQINRDKTADPIIIPINDFAKKIIVKYKNEETGEIDFPRFAAPVFGRYLKEMAKLLGFDREITKVYLRAGERVTETNPLYEVISAKAGRKTFITLSIGQNMNHEILMRYVGHKSYSTLRDYLGVTDDDLQSEMRNGWNIDKMWSRVAEHEKNMMIREN